VNEEDTSAGDHAFVVAESVLGVVLLALLGLAVALGKLLRSFFLKTSTL
jgi:hypothetical protein